MFGSTDKWAVIKIFISVTSFFHTQLFTELGHAISDTGNWHMIIEAWFQSHGSLCGICGKKKWYVHRFLSKHFDFFIILHSRALIIQPYEATIPRINPISLSQLNKNYPQDLKGPLVST